VAARIAQLVNKQVALLLLRYVALRTLRLPACTVAAAAEFDEAIRSSLAALLGTPALTDEAWLQATLPLWPGLGFSLAAGGGGM
jgi:hypothetical protein